MPVCRPPKSGFCNKTIKRHDRTGQDRTGQDRTGQDRTGQDKTRQDQGREHDVMRSSGEKRKGKISKRSSI
eukprot:COSAG06_NODE_60820_length_269_cov_1.352941_1_plen_70_part_01